MADDDRSVLIRGGDVVDATGERRADVLIEDGRIVAVEPGPRSAGRGTGCSTPAAASWRPASSTCTPTCASRAGRRPRRSRPAPRAAALGGYTAVVAMPNTEPAIDCAAVVREVLDARAQARCCDVHVGRRHHRRPGRRARWRPMAEMAALGVRIFTDDGTGVQDDRLMRRAMEYASGLGRHPGPALRGSTALAAGGHMHEGEWSSRLGIPGHPAEAEELMVMRDLALARLTGAPRPLPAPVDRRLGRAWCAAAKAAGLAVTAEATPHHFTLTDAELRRLRPGVQGQPAAAHRRRRRRRQGRAGRRHHRRHRHRPRPPHPGGQGAAVRPGPARACSASRRRWRWP